MAATLAASAPAPLPPACFAPLLGPAEGARGDHVFGAQDVVEFVLGEDVLFEDDVGDVAARGQGELGDFGGALVADVGVERGGQADAVGNELTAALAVGGDAGDAFVAQGAAGRGAADPCC